MKLRIIILLFISFTSLFLSQANASKIEQLFDIPYGVEGYKVELIELENIEFENASVQKTYNEFISLNTTLKGVLMDKYRNNELTYYQMQDTISYYNDFVFYTQKAFGYISLEEKIDRSSETQKAIYNAYTSMRNSYIKFINVLEG